MSENGWKGGKEIIFCQTHGIASSFIPGEGGT